MLKKCLIQSKKLQAFNFQHSTFNLAYILFDLPFVNKAKTRPKNKAALMPAAVAAIPPEKTPMRPSFSTASLTPRPIAAPKPIKGVEIPHPNISYRGSYAPTAYTSTPVHT